MNRGQILYRAAEMLDGRRAQFVEVLGGGRASAREVEQAVEALVWYAGWTDKLAQVAGNTNPVAGPYFNFTIPEPTGVVGIVAPDEPPLLGLVSRIAPALVGGNAVVALASETGPLAAIGEKNKAVAALPPYDEGRLGGNQNLFNNSTTMTIGPAEGAAEVILGRQDGAPVFDLHLDIR